MSKIITFFLLCSLLNMRTVYAETINFYTWRLQDITLWQEISKQNKIPGVKIIPQAVSRHFYKNFLIYELQIGKADLFLWYPGASNLKTLTDNNFIEPYAGDLSNINSSALQASKGPDGQYYGVPFAIQLQSIMVNKNLLEKHGLLKEPSSLDELTELFDKLKAKDITPFYFAGGTNWYVTQVLSEVLMAGLVDEKFAQGLIKGEKCFTDNKYKQIFTTLKDWMDAGYLNSDITTGDYGVMAKSVSLGNSAMSIDGGWMASPTSDYYVVDPSFKFDFWSVPGTSSKVYALGDGSFQVGATSHNKEVAEKVLKFTTTKEFAEMFAEYVNELPGYGKEFYIKPGELKQMATLVAEKTYKASLFTSYELNQGSPTYNELVLKAIQDTFKNKSAKQVTNDIQAGLNSWDYVGKEKCAL